MEILLRTRAETRESESVRQSDEVKVRTEHCEWERMVS